MASKVERQGVARLLHEYRRADRSRRDTLWWGYIGMRALFEQIEREEEKKAARTDA